MIAFNYSTESTSYIMLRGRTVYFGVMYVTSDSAPACSGTATINYVVEPYDSYDCADTSEDGYLYPEEFPDDLKIERPQTREDIRSPQWIGHFSNLYTFRVRDTNKKAPLRGPYVLKTSCYSS